MAVRLLRWILLVPLTVAGWYLVLLLGMVLLTLADGFCPPEEMVSGYCTAPWYAYVDAGVFYFCSGLAAILWVLLAALIAPAWRRGVGWVAFAIGALVASAMTLHLGAWDDLAISLAAGFATAWWIQRARWSVPSPTGQV